MRNRGVMEGRLLPVSARPQSSPDGQAGRGRVLGVLLAAGAGSRFAGTTHKLLASYRDRPLLAHAWDALRDAELDGVAVVSGAVDLSGVVPQSAIVHNPAWSTGQRSSVVCAIDHARAGGYDAVVIGLADQALVPSSAWTAVGRTDGDIVVADYGGNRGNPVKLSSRVWMLFVETCTDADAGARTLIVSRPDLVRAVACEGSAADVDTLEDLDGLGAHASNDTGTNPDTSTIED